MRSTGEKCGGVLTTCGERGIIVAYETVAHATIFVLGGQNMPMFMKMLNNISRSQAIYRHSKISAGDLQSGHYAYVLAISKNPGCSQEELARELCINKSTVARNINVLEERGYIKRNALPNDKRQFAVYPTEKMLNVLPEVKASSREWMDMLADGIADDELKVFYSVLEHMQEKARKIIGEQESSK